jgi:dipeptidyl aminopeptidase/acylaminoacyl peptidase
MVILLAAGVVCADDANKPAAKKKDADKKDELTLEKLFPEKGLFGRTASSTAFSHDGRYAAYLYRPYPERRHGSDLWIYDFQTGKSQRVTSVSVLAPFQESTRQVQQDRIKKAKSLVKTKNTKKTKNPKKTKGKDDKQDDGLTDQQRRGDWVSDKDADDEKAPRYRGVSRFQWSPRRRELLFVSQGDIYQWKVGGKEPTRLTKTQADERSVRYLPDGSGFTYMSDDALMRVTFSTHLVEQLDPPLPSGEEMTSYRLSEDGTRLALVTREGKSRSDAGRKVNIVKYRDRFADVTQVSRHVADDEKIEQTISIYLYDLTDILHEEGELIRIFRRELTGPRDVVGTPSWSLDSQRVVFAVFSQEASELSVLETAFEHKPDQDDKKQPAAKDAKDPEDDDQQEKDKAEDQQDSSSRSGPKVIERKARVVHRQLHTGGPNTPRMVQPRFLADNRHIVLLSEQTGFRHLHVIDPIYETIVPLTSGRYEVYPIRMSEDRRLMFVTSTRDNAAREQVYKIVMETGEMTRLSIQHGTYTSVAVSDDGKRVIANYVRYGTLADLFALDVANKKMQKITDAHPQSARFVCRGRPQFFTYQNRHGHDIHGHLFKPDGWSKGDKRPLLIYVYGGPLGTRKMVIDGSYSSDSFLFAWYMAKVHGYMTCTIDPRGVSGYGALFERSNFEQVGRPQVEDLVDGVHHLVENFGVDPKRVGIHGWSFGGFQTQMCLYTAPDEFAAGIAGAGPTEWENYNSWYTTGTIGSSRVGQADLKKYSLLPLAKNLKARLLLVHGMEDSNVLYQDTVRVYRELLKAGKETLVELFLDPTGGHSLGGDVKRLGRYRKYEEFLLRTLGHGR